MSFWRINVCCPAKHLRSVCGAENMETEIPANGSFIVQPQTRDQSFKINHLLPKGRDRLSTPLKVTKRKKQLVSQIQF